MIHLCECAKVNLNQYILSKCPSELRFHQVSYKICHTCNILQMDNNPLLPSNDLPSSKLKIEIYTVQ